MGGEDKKFFATPQSFEPLQQAGAIPAHIVAGWDPADNSYRVVNLDFVRKALEGAENTVIVDKLDGRNAAATVTIPASAILGRVLTAEITVPTGEIWLISDISFDCEVAVGAGDGEAAFNVLISSYPQTPAGTFKPHLPANIPLPIDAEDARVDILNVVNGWLTDHEKVIISYQGELGIELKLKGGDKVVLYVIVTEAYAIAVTQAIVMTLYGRKGRKIL